MAPEVTPPGLASHITLSLEPNDARHLAALCGQLDSHLRQIEKRLDITIQNRSNHFELRGAQERCQMAASLLSSLYTDIENGAQLSPESIHLRLQEADLELLGEPQGSQIYDLGCSWGASLLSVAREPACDRCELIGIDNSESMLGQASNHLAQFPEAKRIQLQHADVLDTPLHNASVVIMNYTLQFIPIEEREGLLKRIREAMMPGDVLILSEKLALPDPRLNEYLIDLHHDFKRQQGYSDLEIAQKRQALEDVLVPETRQTHVERLKKVGFSRCDVWFQCLNFGSLIAIA